MIMDARPNARVNRLKGMPTAGRWCTANILLEAGSVCASRMNAIWYHAGKEGLLLKVKIQGLQKVVYPG